MDQKEPEKIVQLLDDLIALTNRGRIFTREWIGQSGAWVWREIKGPVLNA